MLLSAWGKVSSQVILELPCIQNFRWQVILMRWVERKFSSCLVNTSSVSILVFRLIPLARILRAFRPWSLAYLALISKLRYIVLLVKHKLVVHLDYAVSSLPTKTAIIYNSTAPVNCSLVWHRHKVWYIKNLVAISLSKRTSLEGQSLNLFCAIEP